MWCKISSVHSLFWLWSFLKEIISSTSNYLCLYWPAFVRQSIHYTITAYQMQAILGQECWLSWSEVTVLNTSTDGHNISTHFHWKKMHATAKMRLKFSAWVVRRTLRVCGAAASFFRTPVKHCNTKMWQRTNPVPPAADPGRNVWRWRSGIWVNLWESYREAPASL